MDEPESATGEPERTASELAPIGPPTPSRPGLRFGLERALGALNGAVGDYLARTKNGLATELLVLRDRTSMGGPVETAPSRSIVVLVHGLMCTEHVFQFEDGSDYGSRLRDEAGFSPWYIRYNSGLPIADNGALLSEQLERHVASWPVPVERIVLVGYSMGGLVVRAACHDALQSGRTWLSRVDGAVYVGTPHLGAPLERYARVVADFLARIDDPYARLVADLAGLRSEGVKDLGDADIRHEDRARRRATTSFRDPSHPVPLLTQIRHCLIAGTLDLDPAFVEWFGDALVPIPSATAGRAATPRDQVHVLSGVHHVALAHHHDVYARIRAWCAPEEGQPTTELEVTS